MLHHTKAVVRGTSRALVVTDLPFMTYHLDDKQAAAQRGPLPSGGRRPGGEAGGRRRHGPNGAPPDPERHLPVMGHLGLTPQSVNQLGGYRVQGKLRDEADRLMSDAVALEEAGAFCLVLELVVEPVARAITERLTIPTIGIGAGPSCDGQVQVLHDMLGLYTDFVPKHAKLYADLAGVIRSAVEQYVHEVQEHEFPTAKESFGMEPAGR